MHTTHLDERHAGLLTLIVLGWVLAFYVGIRAARAGFATVLVATLVCLIAVAVALRVVDPAVGLGLAQAPIFVALGALYAMRSA